LQFGVAELQTIAHTTQEERKPVMKSMERSLAQIDEMIHLIIEVEQIENTVRNGQMAKVDLNLVMNSLYEEYKDKANGKKQQLHWSDYTQACIVEGDLHLLRRIIGNLISNAIKYSPEGKSIFMLLEKQEGQAEIRVIDEGPGIDAGDEQFIFQKYYRNIRTGMGKTASVSLGLGLFLVRQYVELHKGAVSVHTRPGEGTTFKILFPLEK
jgi:signal transduction histidine kinase